MYFQLNCLDSELCVLLLLIYRMNQLEAILKLRDIGRWCNDHTSGDLRQSITGCLLKCCSYVLSGGCCIWRHASLKIRLQAQVCKFLAAPLKLKAVQIWANFLYSMLPLQCYGTYFKAFFLQFHIYIVAFQYSCIQRRVVNVVLPNGIVKFQGKTG